MSPGTSSSSTPGNRRQHVSPDVMVVKGVEPRRRDNYLVWEEGKAPDVAIEVTSPSTRNEDLKEKHAIYQDRIRVQEYFLFDPRSEYLTPPLQGYRLKGGVYVPIESAAGRLPSQELGLHLEKHEKSLRFHDPRTGAWLSTPDELLSQAEQTAAEMERLRRELAALKRKDAGSP